MRTALLPASLLAAALALPCAAPARASILVTIDKTTQRMSIAVDGATRYVWPVSTGRPGYDTPNGTFRPFRMEADHFSKEWDDAPMPHSVFFTKIGHAIHGSLDTRHLGSAASHGCVRLSPEHASTLYALVQAEGLTDTTVVIAGHTPMATADAARRRAPVEAAAGEPLEVLLRIDDMMEARLVLTDALIAESLRRSKQEERAARARGRRDENNNPEPHRPDQTNTNTVPAQARRARTAQGE